MAEKLSFQSELNHDCWLTSQCMTYFADWLEVSKVGKKAGNTHISQDSGKYW